MSTPSSSSSSSSSSSYDAIMDSNSNARSNNGKRESNSNINNNSSSNNINSLMMGDDEAEGCRTTSAMSMLATAAASKVQLPPASVAASAASSSSLPNKNNHDDDDGNLTDCAVAMTTEEEDKKEQHTIITLESVKKAISKHGENGRISMRYLSGIFNECTSRYNPSSKSIKKRRQKKLDDIVRELCVIENPDSSCPKVVLKLRYQEQRETASPFSRFLTKKKNEFKNQIAVRSPSKLFSSRRPLSPSSTRRPMIERIKKTTTTTNNSKWMSPPRLLNKRGTGNVLSSSRSRKRKVELRDYDYYFNSSETSVNESGSRKKMKKLDEDDPFLSSSSSDDDKKKKKKGRLSPPLTTSSTTTSSSAAATAATSSAKKSKAKKKPLVINLLSDDASSSSSSSEDEGDNNDSDDDSVQVIEPTTVINKKTASTKKVATASSSSSSSAAAAATTTTKKKETTATAETKKGNESVINKCDDDDEDNMDEKLSAKEATTTAASKNVAKKDDDDASSSPSPSLDEEEKQMLQQQQNAGGGNDPQRVIRQQQQRLLLLRHASKCKLGAACTTKFCSQMKPLWQHMKTCRDKDCTTRHCQTSRCVITHYRICKIQGKTATCEICGPVIEHIRKSEANQDLDSSNDPLTEKMDGADLTASDDLRNVSVFGSDSANNAQAAQQQLAREQALRQQQQQQQKNTNQLGGSQMPLGLPNNQLQQNAGGESDASAMLLQQQSNNPQQLLQHLSTTTKTKSTTTTAAASIGSLSDSVNNNSTKPSSSSPSLSSSALLNSNENNNTKVNNEEFKEGDDEKDGGRHETTTTTTTTESRREESSSSSLLNGGGGGGGGGDNKASPSTAAAAAATTTITTTTTKKKASTSRWLEQYSKQQKLDRGGGIGYFGGGASLRDAFLRGFGGAKTTITANIAAAKKNKAAADEEEPQPQPPSSDLEEYKRELGIGGGGIEKLSRHGGGLEGITDHALGLTRSDASRLFLPPPLGGSLGTGGGFFEGASVSQQQLIAWQQAEAAQMMAYTQAMATPGMQPTTNTGATTTTTAGGGGGGGFAFGGLGGERALCIHSASTTAGMNVDVNVENNKMEAKRIVSSSSEKEEAPSGKIQTPKTAHGLFYDHIRPYVEKENPKFTAYADLLPIMRAKYDALTFAERKKWEDEAAKDKVTMIDDEENNGSSSLTVTKLLKPEETKKKKNTTDDGPLLSKSKDATKQQRRNKSAYLLFFDHIRPTVERENPRVTAYADLVPIITAKYKALSDEERKKWENESSTGDDKEERFQRGDGEIAATIDVLAGKKNNDHDDDEDDDGDAGDGGGGGGKMMSTEELKALDEELKCDLLDRTFSKDEFNSMMMTASSGLFRGWRKEWKDRHAYEWYINYLSDHPDLSWGKDTEKMYDYINQWYIGSMTVEDYHATKQSSTTTNYYQHQEEEEEEMGAQPSEWDRYKKLVNDGLLLSLDEFKEEMIQVSEDAFNCWSDDWKNQHAYDWYTHYRNEFPGLPCSKMYYWMHLWYAKGTTVDAYLTEKRQKEQQREQQTMDSKWDKYKSYVVNTTGRNNNNHVGGSNDGAAAGLEEEIQRMNDAHLAEALGNTNTNVNANNGNANDAASSSTDISWFDHINTDIPDSNNISSNANGSNLPSLPTPTARTYSHNHFPTKLHDMLDDADRYGHAHIVSWCPDGKAFRIHNSGNEMLPILEKYLGCKSYENFFCDLEDVYGFKSDIIEKITGTVRWSHELFVRGKHSLCSGMRRYSSSRNKSHTTGSSNRRLSSGFGGPSPFGGSAGSLLTTPTPEKKIVGNLKARCEGTYIMNATDNYNGEPVWDRIYPDRNRFAFYNGDNKWHITGSQWKNAMVRDGKGYSGSFVHSKTATSDFMKAKDWDTTTTTTCSPETSKTPPTAAINDDSTELKITLKHLVVDEQVHSRVRENNQECQPTATYNREANTIVVRYHSRDACPRKFEICMSKVKEKGCWTVYDKSKYRFGGPYFENGFLFLRTGVNICSSGTNFTTHLRNILLEFEDNHSLIKLLKLFSGGNDDVPIQYNPIDVKAAISRKWNDSTMMGSKIQNLSRSVTSLVQHYEKEQCNKKEEEDKYPSITSKLDNNCYDKKTLSDKEKTKSSKKKKSRPFATKDDDDEDAAISEPCPKKLKLASSETKSLEQQPKSNNSVPIKDDVDRNSSFDQLMSLDFKSLLSTNDCRSMMMKCDTPTKTKNEDRIECFAKVKKNDNDFDGVKEILDRRVTEKGEVWYKLRWSGYPEKGYEDSWEPSKNLDVNLSAAAAELFPNNDQSRGKDDTSSITGPCGGMNQTIDYFNLSSVRDAIGDGSNKSKNDVASDTNNNVVVGYRNDLNSGIGQNVTCEVHVSKNEDISTQNDEKQTMEGVKVGDHVANDETLSAIKDEKEEAGVDGDGRTDDDKSSTKDDGVKNEDNLGESPYEETKETKENIVVENTGNNCNDLKNTNFFSFVPMIFFFGICFHTGIFTYTPFSAIVTKFIITFFRFTMAGFILFPFIQWGMTYPLRINFYAAILIMAASYEVTSRTKYVYEGQHLHTLGSLTFIIYWVILSYSQGMLELRHVIPLPVIGMLFVSSIDSISSSLDIITTTLAENQTEIKLRLNSGASTKYDVGNELIVYAIRKTSMSSLNLMRDVLILGSLGLIGRYVSTSVSSSKSAGNIVGCQMQSVLLIALCTLSTILLNYALLMESEYFSVDSPAFDSEWFSKNNDRRSLIELVKYVFEYTFRSKQ